MVVNGYVFEFLQQKIIIINNNNNNNNNIFDHLVVVKCSMSTFLHLNMTLLI